MTDKEADDLIDQLEADAAGAYDTHPLAKPLREYVAGLRSNNARLRGWLSDLFEVADRHVPINQFPDSSDAARECLDDEDSGGPPCRQPYDGPIEVGERFVWEPDKPHARANVTVTEVRNRPNDERVIQTLDDEGRYHWNEESRFREACVRVQPAE
jgi:hypothetical protein